MLIVNTSLCETYGSVAVMAADSVARLGRESAADWGSPLAVG